MLKIDILIDDTLGRKGLGSVVIGERENDDLKVGIPHANIQRFLEFMYDLEKSTGIRLNPVEVHYAVPLPDDHYLKEAEFSFQRKDLEDEKVRKFLDEASKVALN